VGPILLIVAALAACSPPGRPAADADPDAGPPTSAPADAAGTARAGGGAAAAAGPGGPPGAAAAVVVDLVDGDTLDLRLAGVGKERVRLIGIDTPETKKPGSPVECFGPEASAYLASLVPVGSDVRLLRDVEVRDQFGRLLGYLFRASDGLFVNLAMAADGYAEALSIAPNTTFAAEVNRAVGEARRDGRGKWAACPPAGGGAGR
jgi:micrococcal nuclease